MDQRRAVSIPVRVGHGVAGRLAGHLIVLLNRQRDVVGLSASSRGPRVLEVGPSPGGLIRLLRRRPVAADARTRRASPAVSPCQQTNWTASGESSAGCSPPPRGTSRRDLTVFAATTKIPTKATS
jgi:hypothetical protein